MKDVAAVLDSRFEPHLILWISLPLPQQATEKLKVLNQNQMSAQDL